MPNRDEKRRNICERLQQLGYARERDIRLYGEKFHLISNPVADGDGYSVEGTTRESASIRRMRIPLSLVYTLRKELALDK
jgi:hypothetical protein